MTRVGLILRTVLVIGAAALPVMAQTPRGGTWIAADSPQVGTTVQTKSDIPTIFAPLHPEQLAVADHDILDPAGGVLVRSGAQLVATGTGLDHRGTLFCTFRSVERSSIDWRADTVSNKLVCLQDDQGDGRFERAFHCYALRVALLIDGKCHKEPIAVRQARYARRPPETFRSDMVVGLLNIGRGKLMMCVGTVRSCRKQPLGPYIALQPGGPAAHFPGGALQITAGRDASLVTVSRTTDHRLPIAPEWRLFSIWL